MSFKWTVENWLMKFSHRRFSEDWGTESYSFEIQLTGYFVGASLWAFKTKPSFIFTIPGIAMDQKWLLEMTTPSSALGRSSWKDLLWSFVPGCRLWLLPELSLWGLQQQQQWVLMGWVVFHLTRPSEHIRVSHVYLESCGRHAGAQGGVSEDSSSQRQICIWRTLPQMGLL